MAVTKISGRSKLALRALAVFEAIKGLLALAAAFGVVSLRDTDLQAAAQTFLQQHGIDPERHYTRMFIESIARATHYHPEQLVAFACVYGVVRIIEGYGLWKDKHWAEWFAALLAGIYLPFEIGHFVHRPTLFTATVIVFNIALVIYLTRLIVRRRAMRESS